MRRSLKFILLLLFVFGVLRLFLERGLDKYFREKDYEAAGLSIELGDKFSQNAYLATLGGFRSFIASMFRLRGVNYWQDLDWAELDNVFSVCTELQPRMESYWLDASRHLSFDAYSHYRNFSKLVLAERNYFSNYYLDRGRDYLLRGLDFFRNKYVLHKELGRIYSDRYYDHEKSYEYFKKASEYEGAPYYIDRRVMYELYKSGKDPRRAYEMARGLFLAGSHNHLPTLLSIGYKLETALGIDGDFRVFSDDVLPREYKFDKDFRRLLDVKKVIGKFIGTSIGADL